MCHFALRLVMAVLIKKKSATFLHINPKHIRNQVLFSLLSNTPTGKAPHLPLSPKLLPFVCPNHLETSLSKVWSSFCFLQDIRIGQWHRYSLQVSHPEFLGDSIHRAGVWALWCRRRILPRARTMLDCYTHGPSSPTVPLPSEEGNRLGFRANTFK